MNPKTLLSCMEQKSCGNERPRRVAQQRGDTTVPRQWLGSCTVRRLWIPCVGTAIPGSQNKRVSPEDHCGRPHLPVSQCRFLLAFDGQTASSEPDTEWTFLRMKISKAVYVRRSGSLQERLWAPNTKSSPKVMHWPWRMSKRGDFPPVAGQYFINSVVQRWSSSSKSMG